MGHISGGKSAAQGKATGVRRSTSPPSHIKYRYLLPLPPLFTFHHGLHYQPLSSFNNTLWLLYLNLPAMPRWPAFTLCHMLGASPAVVLLILTPHGVQAEAQMSKGTPHSLRGAPDEKGCVCRRGKVQASPNSGTFCKINVLSLHKLSMS